jgi:hypothetical protein
MGEHRTTNIELRTPNAAASKPARAPASNTDSKKFDLEERLLKIATVQCSMFGPCS